MQTRIIIPFIVTLVLFLGMGSVLCAKPAVNSGDPDQSLVLKSTTFTPQAVSINYEIPFGGMVLFYLLDEEEQVIWRTQEALDRGEHSILLKAEKFNQGKRYDFRIEYKGKSYTGQFEGR